MRKFRNKKYIFALIALGTLLSVVPSSFAQVDTPCGTVGEQAPSCQALDIDHGVIITIDGAATKTPNPTPPADNTTPATPGAGAPATNTTPPATGTGTTVVAAPTISCCCKTDHDSNKKLLAALGGDLSNAKKLTSCPEDVCTQLPTSGVVPTRNQFAPEPCGDNLSNPNALLTSPLKGLSDFISKWYAAFFYLAVVLAIIQIFRGGVEYAIAAGNSSKTEEAKNIIIEAVIGLGVALLAAGILVFLRGPGIFAFT